MKMEYSSHEKIAMVSLVLVLCWGLGYFAYRHSLSGRFGHPTWPILNVIGWIMLILMIKNGMYGAPASKPRSFRWVYFASIGFAALAMINMTFCPHCPDINWEDHPCPPDDIRAWCIDNLGYDGPIPEPYKTTYNNNGIPFIKNETARNHCIESTDYPYGREIRTDIVWPPPELCKQPPGLSPVSANIFKIGLLDLMPLVGMVGFLIPLVGMSSSASPMNTRKFLICGGFFLLLAYLYLWAHAASILFGGGSPWYKFKYAMDYTVIFYYVISTGHLIYSWKAYNKFVTIPSTRAR